MEMLKEPVVRAAKPFTSLRLMVPVESIAPVNDRFTQSDFNERLGVTLIYLKILDDMLSPEEWVIK